LGQPAEADHAEAIEAWHTRQPQAMDYHDLPAFMEKLAANPEQSARALEVTILTLSRTIEVQNMRWPKLDLESGL